MIYLYHVLHTIAFKVYPPLLLLSYAPIPVVNLLFLKTFVEVLARDGLHCSHLTVLNLRYTFEMVSFENTFPRCIAFSLYTTCEMLVIFHNAGRIWYSHIVLQMPFLFEESVERTIVGWSLCPEKKICIAGQAYFFLSDVLCVCF